MKKRLLAWLLVLALLLPYVSVNAEAVALTEKQIRVNFSGAVEKQQVLVDKSGTVLAPLSWITYYGARMTCEDAGSCWTYYSKDQKEEKNFAKRLFIEKKTGEFTVGLYFNSKAFARFINEAHDHPKPLELVSASWFGGEILEEELDSYFAQKNTKVRRVYGSYLPLYQGKFSEMVEYGQDIWVPLAELLPLIDVEAAVSEDDGSLCMQPVVMTFFRAMYEHSEHIRQLRFDSSDVVGNNIMAGGGWIVSTLTGDVDNLDFIFDSGRINDYEKLFKDYLLDNETYLSLFEADENAIFEYISEVGNDSNLIKSVYEHWGTLFEELDNMGVLKAINPDTYEEFLGGVNAFTETMSGAMSLFEYANIYINQVEDHRIMLGAVYDYKVGQALVDGDVLELLDLTSWPSYKAAENIQGLYNTDSIDSEILFKESVRDYINKFINNEIKKSTMKTLGPWYIAIELTKIFKAKEYQYVVNAELINLVSNTVDYSYDIYSERLDSLDYSADKVNDMRLCVMMSMVASRHAYDTYWQGSRQDDVDAIDEILKDIYLAGIWQDFDCSDTYSKRLKDYRSGMENLELSDVPENSAVTMAEMGMMAVAMEDNGWDTYQWALEDTDNDGEEDLVFKFYTTDSGGETFWAELDVNDTWITCGLFDTAQVPTNVRFDCPDLSAQFAGGDTDAIIRELDSYFAGRDGFMFAESEDVDQDGDMDRVYCVYNVEQMWFEYGDQMYLNLYDPAMTVLVAEREANGVTLRISRLVGQPLEYSEGDYSNYASFLQGVPHSLDRNILNIDGYLYDYSPDDGGYVYMGSAEMPTDYSVEGFLAGRMEVLTGTGGSLAYTDPDDPNWAEGYLDGEDIHIRYKDGSTQIEMLRVIHNGGALAIAGTADTSMTKAELKTNLPNYIWMVDDAPMFEDGRIPAWMDPYPVYGTDGDIAWYEISFYWMNSIDEKIYFVVLALDSDSPDAGVVSITFWLEESPSWNLIHHLAGVS